MYNLVQFDYYGDELFEVKIYKETAIECNYPSIHPEDYRNIDASKRWKEAQYVLDIESLKFEKKKSLLAFNACANNLDYVEMVVINFDIDPRRINLRLKPSWKRFFNKWQNGTKVVLRFVKKTWEIEVE